MKITFLGTGTSQGVPIIGCKCEVCKSVNTRDKRLRSSIAVEVNGKRLIIDSGPDFRYQMLREGYDNIDAIILTHAHKDHISGLDDVRAFNYIQGRAIDIYASNHTVSVIKKDFDYAFAEYKYPGVPEINVHIVDNAPFSICDIEVVPIQGLHHKMDVFGYKIGRMAYITDMNYISDLELEKIKDIDVLIISALRHEQHISHFTLQEAIEVSQKIDAKRTYFTHISHQLGSFNGINPTLPNGMSLGYDRLEITI